MSYVYFDIETEWTRHSDPLPIFVLAGFAVDDGPVQYRYTKETARRVVLDAVARGDTLVCHRGAFEMGTLEIPRGVKWHDTAMVATIEGAAQGDPDAAGHSLKSLGKKAGFTYRHDDSKGEKGIQGSYVSGAQISPKQHEYLADDVVCTRAVHRWQQEKYGNRTPNLAREIEWSRDVFEMGRRGLHVDIPRLDGLIAQYQQRAAQLRNSLKDCGIIQPRGPKKDPWRKSSVDEATVQELLKAAGVTDVTVGSEDAEEDDQLLVADRLTLVKSGDPRLKLLADYKTEEKRVGLVKAYYVDGGVVRARYNSLVATGRMSCSKPNVQQVQKKGGLRECWIPGDGKVFVEGDYSMLELYTFSDTCARWGIHSRLREALNAGQDVHSIVAANPNVGTRALAKVFNYGGLGGMGPETMQENVEKQLSILLPVEQIALAQAGWRETWPEVTEYWRHNTQIAHPAGFKRNKWGVMKMTYKYKVTNPQSGRQRLAFYCASQNFGFQGPGGDIIKSAQEKAHKRGLNPVAVLHDQLLCAEVASSALEAKMTLREVMREAAEEVCPNVRWPDQDVHIFTERWESKGG